MHRLLVKGQGVFIFKTKTNFWLYNEDNTDGLYICDEYVQRVKTNEKIIDQVGSITWFSLDAHNHLDLQDVLIIYPLCNGL